MADVQKREDAILEHLHAVCQERDEAQIQLAKERVAHRRTLAQLREVTELATRV